MYLLHLPSTRKHVFGQLKSSVGQRWLSTQISHVCLCVCVDVDHISSAWDHARRMGYLHLEWLTFSGDSHALPACHHRRRFWHGFGIFRSKKIRWADSVLILDTLFDWKLNQKNTLKGWQVGFHTLLTYHPQPPLCCRAQWFWVME